MRKRICLTALIFLAALASFHIPSKAQAAVKWLDVDATIKGKNQITLSWKKRPAAEYEIYRANVNKKGSTGKYRKIATISGKKKAYTDKVPYKKRFGYRIKGYTLKGKKKVYQYHGQISAYTGVGQTSWTDYQQTDSEISPKAIPLAFAQSEGMEPTAYEIYRGTGNKSFKKLVTLKSRKMSGEYTDKSVSSGKTYYYRIRAYRTMKGKRYYGDYSSVMKLAAVRRVGQYAAAIVPTEEEASSFVLRLTSNKENGKTVFKKNQFQSVRYHYLDSENKKSVFLQMKAVEYSTDNMNWQKLPGQVVLPAGQTIYFKLETKDGSTFQPAVLQSPRAAMVDIGILYNDLESYMTVDCVGKTAEARVNLTRYH